MDKFLQIHLLTSYPPSNLNRDDLGRPKTAVVGGSTRLRISSQSLKRAWRTSEVFESALQGHVGIRTKAMGKTVYGDLVARNVAHKDALVWAGEIASVFGKRKTLGNDEKKKLKEMTSEERLKQELIEVEIEQLAHFGPDERQAIDELVAKMAARGTGPEKEELGLLRKKAGAADIALFGRMLAAQPAFNMEAAAQVAHAFTTNKVAVEDDFFTAVDDLNSGTDDMGAGHMGETEFGSGIFYAYLCVDRDLLLENLDGDRQLAAKSIAALIECAATVSPTGKQNSFASRARASFVVCETGSQQPRSLAVAFLKPVGGQDMLSETIERLRSAKAGMDKVYGLCSNKCCELNALTGEGSLQALIQCATEQLA